MFGIIIDITFPLVFNCWSFKVQEQLEQEKKEKETRAKEVEELRVKEAAIKEELEEREVLCIFYSSDSIRFSDFFYFIFFLIYF